MRNIVKDLLNQIKKDKRKRTRSFAVMLVLSMLVASGVLWQIRITGITMSGEALCGLLAHRHTQECLGMQVVCGLEESEEHRHTDACYTTETVQICQQEEHTHVAGECYVQDVSECDKVEYRHTDACFETRTTLICGREESEGHTHTAECKREAYMCGYDQEHEHTLLCYTDETADLETSADWEKTIQALSFNPAEDLTMVARSQIGYAESQRNYKVAEDGQTKKGYTRYGEWYGNPYGDWNAMFVSFCMNYAQHPYYETLKNSGAETMRLAAVDAGLYKTPSEAVPYVGDLVFLDKDSNGKCDTAAIVSGCEEGTMTLVEGDCDGVVAENSYSLDNGTVLGYALLTARTEEPEPTQEPGGEPAKTTTDLARTNTEDTGTDNSDNQQEEPLSDEDGNNVTVTFINGTETVETRTLAAGTAVGELPAVTLEGKGFLGWVRVLADGTLDTEYLEADDLITETVTYAPVFADLVTITFMNGETQFGETVPDVPVGAKLQDYLPGESPEDYIDDEEQEWRFLGWKIAGQDQLVEEDTTVPAGLNENKLVVNAAFERIETCPIYFHDIDPDGEEYVVENVESIDHTVPAGDTVMDWLGEITLDYDGALVGDCIWYYKDGDGAKQAYDLTTPVSSELHLYTYSYRLSLTLQEAETRAAQVDGNTLTLTLREGEKPSAQSLVVDGVDYSTYTWRFTDASNNPLADMTLGDILNNGVTQNISATAAKEAESPIKDSGNAKVRFQVIVNKQLKDLGERDVTLYKLNDDTSYSVSQETLLEAFRDFGFTVDKWIADVYSCPQKTDDSGYWANYPLRQANGLYYNPSVGDLATVSQILYLPGNNKVVERGDWSTLATDYSFYTVTVTDPELLAFAAASEIPNVQYVFNHGTATVTVPVKDGVNWKYTGADAENVTVTTDTEAGTATYTFTNVSSPIELTTAFHEIVSEQREVHFYVYVDNTLKKVTSGTYPAYPHETKHYLSASLLEKVYGEYGFTKDMLNKDTQRDFPHTDHDSPTIWSDAAPAQVINGVDMWFSPILNINTYRATDVYYAPGYTAGDSANRDTALKNAYSFYTVTVTDPDNLVYGADEALPAQQFVFPGTQAPAVDHVEVTVKNSSATAFQGLMYIWLCNGKELTDYTDNGDGTITYIVPTVEKKPYVLTPQPNYVTVSVRDDAHLIYEMGQTPPDILIQKNATKDITLTAKDGYGWLANGKALQGAVYNSNKTEVTYTLSNVTEDVVLTPVQLLDDFQITYEINVQGILTSTRPDINGGSTYVETYHGDGDYRVIRPSRERYTTDATSAMHTYAFQGWRVNNTETILKAGDKLNREELSQFGEAITLSGVWSQLDLSHTVSFFINLELEVANFNNSTARTGKENFTHALFGTEVSIDACPICDDGASALVGAGNSGTDQRGIVLQPKYQNEAAGTDKTIRMLGKEAGVDATYMDKVRNFHLHAFPDDEIMLQHIRKKQAEYIREYEESGFTSVEEYRAANNKIITKQRPGHPMEYVPAGEISPKDYAIRWYVFKYQATDGWHIDGVLVRKSAQLTVTKTFRGEETAIAAVKQGHSYTVKNDGTVETRTQAPYFIEIVGINEERPKVNGQFNMEGRPTLYQLSLESKESVSDDPNTDVITQGYTSYDKETNTYTWIVNLAAEWETWVYERNYEYHQNYDELNQVNTKAEYLAKNFMIDGYNQSRTEYTEDGAQVAVKGSVVDETGQTYETVSLYNIYLPSSAVTISKMDQDGKPIPNVEFQLKVPDGETTKTVDLWKKDGIYYTSQINPNNAEDGKVTDGKIIVGNTGYAIVKGLQDNYPDKSFELVEIQGLEGYYRISGPIQFRFGTIQEEDGEGNVQERDGIILDTEPTVTNVYDQDKPLKVTTDGNVIYVPNVSKPMTVYAEKTWGEGVNEADQKQVTLQLVRNGAVVTGKVVTLDGTVDENEYEPWKAKWENVPAYVAGERASYTLWETVIGDSHWSQEFDDGYDDYVVEYAQPVYEPASGVPTSVTLGVTNRIPVEVSFVKVNHKNQYLSDAVFQLYTDEACTTRYGNPVTSNKYGEVFFGKLPTGTYYMKETTVPDGYQEPGKAYVLEVTSNGITVDGVSTTVLHNTPITVDLNILKVDDEQQPLAGASFRLYRKTDDNREEVVIRNNLSIYPVGEDGEMKGKLTVEDLEIGTYRLTEMQSPDGYYRMKDDITFEVMLSEDKKQAVISCSGESNLWSFNADSNTVTVVNVPGSELPNTGGIGTHYGTMAGLLMMLSSLLYGFLLRRKRERGAV